MLFPFAALQRGKKLLDLRFELCEFQCQYGFPGVQYYVQRSRQLRDMPLHGCPQTTTYAIALHGPAQHLAHRKSHARTRLVVAIAVEHSHVPGKMPLSLFVDGLKICVFQQS
jgi:hypothetical protein